MAASTQGLNVFIMFKHYSKPHCVLNQQGPLLGGTGFHYLLASVLVASVQKKEQVSTPKHVLAEGFGVIV